MIAPRVLLAAAIILVAPKCLFGSLDRFLGTWTASGHGIAKLQIRASGQQVRLHGFGRCHPQDCDWGEVDASAYGPSVEANVIETAKAITAFYDMGFARVIVVVYPGENEHELRVDKFTVFTDSSGRSPTHFTALMRRVKE